MDKPSIKAHKKLLLDKAALYKKKIRENVNDLYGDVENRGKKVLIIAGVLVITYGILDLFLKSRQNQIEDYEDEAEDKKRPLVSTRSKQDSYVIRSIKESIATFILALAKQALNEVMENLKNRKTESKE